MKTFPTLGLFVVPVLVVPVFLGSCILPDLGGAAHVGYMAITPTGNLALQNSARSNNVDSVRVDIEDGFQVDDASTPFLKGELNLGDWDVVASGFILDEEQSSVLTAAFGDIPASTPVRSDLSVVNVKAALAYNLIDLEVFDLSAGVVLDYFDVEMDVRSATAIEKLNFEAPMPLLYGRATVGLGIVSGALEVAWLDLDTGDAAGSYFDLDAMVAVNPLPWVEIVAGYRNILIDADGDIDSQDFGTHLRMSGWYVGGGIRF